MFSARRKPKRVARDDSEKDATNIEEASSTEENGPVVRRPTTAPKSKSKLRTSFAPDEADEGDTTSDGPAVVRPKQRSGGQKLPSTQSLPRFNIDESRRQDLDGGSRPSYSKSALEELRNSTPSTPKDLSVYDPSSGAEDAIPNKIATTSTTETTKQELDLLSKFGSQSLKPTSSSSIPSATEIAEKKARRARLAKEQDAYKSEENYIPLDDGELYDSDGEFKPRRMQVGAYLQKTNENGNDGKNTRLIRDDEDVMEGYDEYTEDAESARITMSHKQLAQARRRDRETMRSLIDSAEGHSHSSGGSSASDSDSDSDTSAQNQRYMTTQTSHGMSGPGLGGLKSHHERETRRPRQPREVTPVPKLGAALEKLRQRLGAVEVERVRVERRRGDLVREKEEVRESQAHIQRSLVEAGEELERVRVRMGVEQRREGEGEGEGGEEGNLDGDEDRVSEKVNGVTDGQGRGHPAGAGTTGVVGRGLDDISLTSAEPS